MSDSSPSDDALRAVDAALASGSNLQPWRVYVATGATRDTLAAAHDDPARANQLVTERAEVAEFTRFFA